MERKEGKERGETKALLLMDIDRIWSIRYPIAPACLHGDKQVFVLAAIAPVWVVVKTKFGASC